MIGLDLASPAGRAPTMSRGRSETQYERFRPTDPPRTDTGEIDAEAIDTTTRYRLPDGLIYRWDGSANFVPYE
jgi:hypothetical protein